METSGCSLVNDSHPPTLLMSLNVQRQQSQFCDCVLRLGHSPAQLYLVHRCVLAACSPVLASILSSSSALVDLQAPFLSASVLALLIDYIYTGTLPYSHTREYYYSLLTAAHYLQMAELQQALRTWQEADGVNVNSKTDSYFCPESSSDGENQEPSAEASAAVDSWVRGRDHHDPGATVVHQTSTRSTELLMDLFHSSGAVTPQWRQRSTEEELRNRRCSLAPPSSPPLYSGPVTVIRHSSGPVVSTGPPHVPVTSTSPVQRAGGTETDSVPEGSTPENTLYHELKSLDHRARSELKSLDHRARSELKSLDHRARSELKSLDHRARSELKSLDHRARSELKRLDRDPGWSQDGDEDGEAGDHHCHQAQSENPGEHDTDTEPEQNVLDSSSEERSFSSSTKRHCDVDRTDLNQHVHEAEMSGCEDDTVHNSAAPEPSGLVNATHLAVNQRFDVKTAETETRQHTGRRGLDRSYFGYLHYRCLSKEDTLPLHQDSGHTRSKPGCTAYSSQSSDEEQTGSFTSSGSTSHRPALTVVPSREVPMPDISTSKSAGMFNDVQETEIPLEENCSGTRTDERTGKSKVVSLSDAEVKQRPERGSVAAESNQGQTTVGVAREGGGSEGVSNPDVGRGPADGPECKNPPSAALHLFQCSLCERSFSQRGSLNRHLRRHLGLRPFSCPCCPMTFSRQYRVTEHMRVHQRCGPGNHLLKPPASSI